MREAQHARGESAADHSCWTTPGWRRPGIPAEAHHELATVMKPDRAVSGVLSLGLTG